MRIGLVAERLSLTSGVGIERYSMELAIFLRERYGAFGCRKIISNPSRKRFSLAANALFKLPTRVAKEEVFRWLPMSSPIQIYHATDPSSAICLSMSMHPTVSTVHDLMCFDDSGISGWFSKLAYDSAIDCDRVIAVSAQTRDDLIEKTKVRPNKVVVINEGVSEGFHRTGVAKKMGMIGVVGNINPRKRLELAVQTFAQVKKSAPKATMDFIGAPIAAQHERYRQMLVKGCLDVGLGGSISFSGMVSEEELIARYNQMSLLLLTTKEEGFGFSILEAQRCGTPVVLMSDAKISPEVKEAAICASDIEDAADKCQRLMTDWDYRSAIIEKGIDHARRFTWERCFESTLDVYRSVLN